MRTRFALVFLLGMYCMPAFAQTTIPEILRSAQNDIKVQQSREITNAANQLRFHVPLLKSVEGRLGINGSALGDTIYGYIRNEDSYGLIIGTNSLREIKRQKQYKTAKIGVYSAEQKLYLEEALYERYQVLTEWYFAQKQKAHQGTLVGLYQKKQDILRVSAEKGQEIKAKDVINSQEDWLKASNQLRETEYQIKQSVQKIAQFLNLEMEISLDTSDFISLRQISLFLLRSPTTISAAQPQSGVRQSLTNLALAKQRYADAQNRQIFNTLRLGYDDPLYLTRPNKFNTTNNLSVRVGLSVPMPSNNRFRSAEAKLDLLEAQMAEARNTSRSNAALLLGRQKIDQLFLLHADFEKQQNSTLITSMLQNQTLRNALSPLEIVELEIAQESLAARSIETAHKITATYIDLVRTMGILADEPFLNYLSELGANW